MMRYCKKCRSALEINDKLEVCSNCVQGLVLLGLVAVGGTAGYLLLFLKYCT